jgi:tripartite-type tricarboxylate transporter receptor subunit TctC
MINILKLVTRLFVGVLLATATLAQAQAQNGDAYPSRPITMIVPFAVGGATDTVGRIMAQKLSGLLAQPVVINNKPGAGGNIGVVEAAKSKPDGYTLLMNVNSSLLINPFLYADAGFDPLKDFAPVGMFATGGMVLVANPSFSPNTVGELITEAKKHPGEIFYASAGNGTLNHIFGEMLNRSAGIKLTHVPYKGSAAAVMGVASGEVPLAFQSLASALPLIKSGKLKAIGVPEFERLSDLPNIPTVGETVPGYGATSWYGLFVPAGTPKEIIAKLHEQVNAAIQDPDVVRQLALQGFKPHFSTVDKFERRIIEELHQWKTIVQQSQAKID